MGGCREAGYSCSILMTTGSSPDQIRQAWYDDALYKRHNTNASAPSCLYYSRILKSISQEVQILECFERKKDDAMKWEYSIDGYLIDYSPQRIFNNPSVQSEIKKIIEDIRSGIKNKIGLSEFKESCNNFKRPIM